MRKPYIALAAAGLFLTLGASAEAGGRSGAGTSGGVGTSFVPPGLKSTNPGFTSGDKGDNVTPYNTKTGGMQNYGPSGWSQGAQGNANAPTPDPWKGITSPPVSSPPGLNGTGR